MEADLINHGATAGTGGGLFWVLWRIRKLEILSAKQEVLIAHQADELEKGSDKFEKLGEKIDGLTREVHNLALLMKEKQQ